MGMPTDEERMLAIKAAKIMREKSLDPVFVAKALLNCNYRMGYLEDVLHLADEYLRSGFSEQIHARLELAIEKAKQLENTPDHKENEVLGL
jgi:hypothetical protein